MEAASKADRARHGVMLVLRIDLDVGHVDHRALQDCPPCPEGPSWACWVYAMHLCEGLTSVVVPGDKMEQLAVELIEPAEESIAQLHGASDDRVEDWLHIGLRLADDAQNLSGCRLLLKRLGQVAIACLQLLEEPHVLDGDDG